MFLDTLNVNDLVFSPHTLFSKTTIITKEQAKCFGLIFDKQDFKIYNISRAFSSFDFIEHCFLSRELFSMGADMADSLFQSLFCRKSFFSPFYLGNKILDKNLEYCTPSYACYYMRNMYESFLSAENFYWLMSPIMYGEVLKSDKVKSLGNMLDRVILDPQLEDIYFLDLSDKGIMFIVDDILEDTYNIFSQALEVRMRFNVLPYIVDIERIGVIYVNDI